MWSKGQQLGYCLHHLGGGGVMSTGLVYLYVWVSQQKFEVTFKY